MTKAHEAAETVARALWWNDPSWLTAASAMLIGLCALAVSIYQSLLMHEQQRISVWPHVLLGHHWQRDDTGMPQVYSYSVRNVGIGLARVMCTSRSTASR